MNRGDLRLWTGLVLFGLGLAGCDSLAPSPTRTSSERSGEFSSTMVSGTTIRAARPVALQVLREHFRFDAENSTGIVLRSQWKDMAGRADDETPGVREILRSRSARRRQRAVIELIERGPDVQVRCQVQVQRLETPERSAFAAQRGSEDRPSEMTSSERGATGETRLREQWADTGRDRQIETTIVDQIANRLGGPNPTSRGL